MSVGDLCGKNHNLFAATQIEGQEIKSDPVTLAIASVVYRLEVENQHTEPLSLDTLKENQKKVIFKMLADYDGSGTFGALAQWDTEIVERLSINPGGLPGKMETVCDAGGNPVGKAFVPQYDERNSSIPFTAVAGKTYEIVGTVSGTDLHTTTKVEVLAPDYDIVVYKENITVTDVKLHDNTESIAFVVMHDDRSLTQQELEHLTSYVLGFDKNQPWIKIGTQVKVADDGTAYLECTPQYGGWNFPAWWFWNWLCLFKVQKGDMHMTMALGEDVVAAAMSVETSRIAWIIFFFVTGLLLLLAWIAFCCATRIRFLRGSFYKITFTKSNNGLGYTVSGRIPLNANKNDLLRYLLSCKFLIPFCEQSVTVGSKSAKFIAKKSPTNPFCCRSYPYSIGRPNRQYFNKGRLSRASIRAIINRDPAFVLDEEMLTGVACSENDKKLDFGDYLVERGSNKIIFFLTRSEEKNLRIARRAQMQRRTGNHSSNTTRNRTIKKSNSKYKRGRK